MDAERMLAEINVFIAAVQAADLPVDPNLLLQFRTTSVAEEPPKKAVTYSLVRATPQKIRVRAGFRFLCYGSDLPWFSQKIGRANFEFEGTTGLVVPSAPNRMATHLRIHGPDTWNESLYPTDWETGDVDEATELPIPLCNPYYDEHGRFSEDFNRDDFEFHWQYVALDASRRGHHTYFTKTTKVQMMFDPRFSDPERDDLITFIRTFLRWNQPYERQMWYMDRGTPRPNRGWESTERKLPCYEHWTYMNNESSWWPLGEILYIQKGYSDVIPNIKNTNRFWPEPIIWPVTPPQTYNRTSTGQPVQSLALPDCFGPRFVMPVSLAFRMPEPEIRQVNFGQIMPSIWSRPPVLQMCSLVIKNDIYVESEHIRGTDAGAA